MQLIPTKLRARLEDFLEEHRKAGCQHEECAVALAKKWVKELRAKKLPEQELLLLVLSVQAYAASEANAEKRLHAYKTGLAGYLTRQMDSVDLSEGDDDEEDEDEEQDEEALHHHPALRIVPAYGTDHRR